MAEARQRRIWAAWGLTLVSAAAIGACVGFVLQFGADLPVVALIVILAAFVGLGCLAAQPFWRRLDEMARQAHLISWYWGGALGGGIALVFSLALVFRGEASRSLFQGAALTLTAQVVGALLVWLGWWARRRSPPV